MSLVQRLLGRLVRIGSLRIIFADGQTEVLGPGSGGPAVTVQFTDPSAPRELLRNAKLKLGELYMEGRLVIVEGSMLDLMTLVAASNPFEAGGRRGGGVLDKGRLSRVRAMFRRNLPDRARRNVAHHYDLDDRLYDLFLDKNRQYSCGYFTDPGNSLDQAQRDKLAHIAAKLDLRPGLRVLDIGCGWGGLALYLHRVAGVEVLGITLSTEQLAYARTWAEREGVADRVTFELVDYRQLTGTFDRIVSVGMFEHVGLAHYHDFYGACARLLADDGVMLLHTIGKLGQAGSPNSFTDKWIFPGYHLPSLSQMQAASEKQRMIVADVEVLRLHYALTLRHWLRRCEARRAEIVAIYDERFFRMWEFYLAGAIVMFEHGGACNFQVQYVKNRRALPLTRDYMTEAEARYRALDVEAGAAAPARAKRRRTAPA